MNRFNFNTTGGFPFELDSLDELYKSFSLLDSIGEVAGNKAIVKGCVLNGSNVSDGVVYVNGEMLEFRGGNKLSTVKIFEQPISKVFENGEQKDVFFHRWVGFGSGEGSMPWADFKLIISLRELQGRILPPGTNPQLYTGSIEAIPEGWQLCNGTNNTPDLRKKFIVGYDPDDPDYNAIGKTGGLKKVALSEAEGPIHNHTGSTDYDGYHDHGYSKSVEGRGYETKSDDNPHSIYESARTTSSGGHSHDLVVDDSGEGKPHENRPPYFTLAYIIYTGQ